MAVVATKVAIVLLLSMMDSRMVSLLVGARFWWLCRLRCRDGMMRVTLLVETGCMPGISQCHHHAENKHGPEVYGSTMGRLWARGLWVDYGSIMGYGLWVDYGSIMKKLII